MLHVYKTDNPDKKWLTPNTTDQSAYSDDGYEMAMKKVPAASTEAKK